MIEYLYYSVLTICFIASLVSFRLHFPIHLRIITVLLGIGWVTESLAIIILPRFSSIVNNMPLYNAYLLVECMLYALYFLFLFRRAGVRNFIQGFLWAGPLLWLCTTFFIFGVNHWNSYWAVIESLFILAMSFGYYYKIFMDVKMISLKRCPEFWVATGLILYFACQLPYIGMLNFLSGSKTMARIGQEFLNVLLVFNIVQYVLFIYAFLCRINFRKSLSSSSSVS